MRYSDFSGWIDRPGERAPALAKSIETDVVVVGGGYTGMTAALRLAERGVATVLLEGSFCGWGASSRNAGHLSPTIAGDPQLLATVYRRRAPALIGFADAAVHFTEGLIERLGIDCEYEATGNVSTVLSPAGLGRARRIAESLAAAGGEVGYVEGPAFGLPGSFAGGIHERAGGILNPGLFARGLRAAVGDSAVEVFEQTPALGIETDPGGVTVLTPAGRVRAERAIVATNAFTRDLPFAPRRLTTPLWVTLAETEPIDPERIAATGWSSRAGIYTQHLILESYRLTARNTVVFGSRRVQTARGPLTARVPHSPVVDDIVRGFHDRFPALGDVAAERTWGGWIAMTASWLPVAGEGPGGVVYALGYNGHGLAQAPYVGAMVADRLVDGSAPEDLKAIWRERLPSLPGPLTTAPALRLGWTIDRLSDRWLTRRARR